MQENKRIAPLSTLGLVMMKFEFSCFQSYRTRASMFRISCATNAIPDASDRIYTRAQVQVVALVALLSS